MEGSTNASLKLQSGSEEKHCKLRLTSIQLQTILKKIEVKRNSRPLIYLSDDINAQVTITPMHFLESIGDKDEEHGLDYKNQQLSSSQKLLESWKNGNRCINKIYELWKKHNYLSLRERRQSSKDAKIGVIVQIKVSNLGRTSKIGEIADFITSISGRDRAAKVLIPSKNIQQR